jgi:hypothetical protein
MALERLDSSVWHFCVLIFVPAANSNTANLHVFLDCTPLLGGSFVRCAFPDVALTTRLGMAKLDGSEAFLSFGEITDFRFFEGELTTDWMTEVMLSPRLQIPGQVSLTLQKCSPSTENVISFFGDCCLFDRFLQVVPRARPPGILALLDHFLCEISLSNDLVDRLYTALFSAHISSDI